MTYDTLFESAQLGPIQISNRIMSSGHQTTLVEDHLPTEDFYEYHLARGRGGAGLVVLEAHAVHQSGLLTDHTIDASTDEIVDAYDAFADRMHETETRVLTQLFHGGRERYTGDYAPPALSASDEPTDRLHVIPRPMETDEVREMISAYVDAAVRMERAGLDGVEIVGSHSYLPAQFWSSKVNSRDDEFGGSLANRCRFTVEIVDRIHERTGDDFVVGLRLSASEASTDGLSFEDTVPIIEHIENRATPDYWSVVVGSSSTQKGCSYIVPPATESEALTQSPGAVIDELVSGSTILTSRINTPRKAVETIEETGADVVGMTRALIADPELPRKTRSGELEDVIPCVACNQGCIGRYQDGLPIRCTINPKTGREAEYGDLTPAKTEKPVLVVGGGPAGLVAATTAAKRGHDVTLVEATDDLGGQINAYADLDHRGRYREWIRTLESRLDRHDVTVQYGTKFRAENAEKYDFEELVLATGARPRLPDVSGSDAITVRTATDALSEADPFGDSVLISDWNGNQAALDVAREAAESGADVEIVTAAYTPGESVQQYVQNTLLGDLYADDVTMTPHYQVRSIEDDRVVLRNQFNETTERRSGIDTLVFSHGGKADVDTYRNCTDLDASIHRIGDCWSPRSLDEAVWEAFETAANI
ncbi:FAD-dependent oxidoreductase [Halopenitus persicus]|uniref:FAD-dependent oxidoreductase n=1 Tax=Halopenitus persicus TaxID=1048396 RepID=UPI000BBB1826|nr:FAD-dependent oxidoreductase [Halopenitus persicus]